MGLRTARRRSDRAASCRVAARLAEPALRQAAPQAAALAPRAAVPEPGRTRRSPRDVLSHPPQHGLVRRLGTRPQNRDRGRLPIRRRTSPRGVRSGFALDPPPRPAYSRQRAPVRRSDRWSRCHPQKKYAPGLRQRLGHEGASRPTPEALPKQGRPRCKRRKGRAYNPRGLQAKLAGPTSIASGCVGKALKI